MIGAGGFEVPTFLYGTAWKEERTGQLVEEALRAGFRGIDTANQRRHYDEAAAGDAMRKLLASGALDRDQLFLQTKYTYRESQDQRLPYDPAADYPTQVRQSFESSLTHLGVDSLDSFLLHGPRTHSGFSDPDRQVWRTMEALHGEGRVRFIGISNITAEQLALVCSIAEVRPAFVQNRCFARLGWDRKVREVCRREKVVYQGFSLLTANIAELASPHIRQIAAKYRATVAQVVFRFASSLGMISLTGTSDPRHMREDLASSDLELTEAEISTIEHLSG